MVSLIQLPNNNLKIVLDDKKTLESLYEDFKDGSKSWTQIWFDLMESHFCNGYSHGDGLIGLTDSPIILDYLPYDEDGNIVHPSDGKVWWFPQYETTDPIETLLENGEVIFTFVD